VLNGFNFELAYNNNRSKFLEAINEPVSFDSEAGNHFTQVVLALINAALAQGKNRTGLNWFLLSLVLGPLATLILLFVEKRQ